MGSWTGREGNGQEVKDTEREEAGFAVLLSTIHNGGNTSFPIDGTRTGIEGRRSTCVPKGMFIESDLFWVKITSNLHS